MRVTFFASVATLIAVIGPARSRGVNISNTWMLPEEGFPVFYRYFRDRISWNEADAVCQFHHANLVTVDTTLQYDAIRAYLKELDISSNVWIGLSRSGEKPNFVWRDFHDLSASDHWQEAIPIGNDPLCTAMDAAADFRWHPLSCGGPDVASFICELPVPSWAMGFHGCLITELPSLTVLFIPEQSAIELTSDCGQEGTKRVVCLGNRDRDELMKLLSCTDLQDDGKSQTTPTFQSLESNMKLNHSTNIGTELSVNAATTSTGRPLSVESATVGTPKSLNIQTTKSWLWTSNTIDTSDYSSPTRQRRETEDIAVSDRTTPVPDVPVRRPQTPSLNPTPSGTPVLVTGEKEDLALDTVTISAGKASSATQNRFDSDGAENVHESTMAPPTSETEKPEPEEFASAINQGQLFSILADGALFDIIELNATDENATLEVKLTTTTSPTSISGEYTTVHYHKEPTERMDRMVVERKTAPLAATTARIRSPHRMESEDHKEVVAGYPIIAHVASDAKLNRTFRKKVPGLQMDTNGFRSLNTRISLDVDNHIRMPDHSPDLSSTKNDTQIVAKVTGIVKDVAKKMSESIRQQSEHLAEISSSIINKSRQFATTKRAGDKNVDNPAKSKLNATAIRKSAKWSGLDLEKAAKAIRQGAITPHVSVLPKNRTIAANLLDKPKTVASPTREVTETRETDTHPSPTPLHTSSMAASLTDDDLNRAEDEDVTEEAPIFGKSADFESEPTLKPNRQRLLTRSNRRSFYPYFFSRVLG